MGFGTAGKEVISAGRIRRRRRASQWYTFRLALIKEQ
jgi:hypothetical protein